jgi:pSer/pThr/pTyr-binding forkhead associated (FHA) protein
MADDKLHLKLSGIAGFIKGESFLLKPGSITVIGRSRSCDISLRELKQTHGDTGDIEGSKEDHYKTVSRQHVRISFKGEGEIVIEDLSHNGSFLDGNRISTSATISDLTKKSHELKLGTNEAFKLELAKDEAPRKSPKVSVKRSKA